MKNLIFFILLSTFILIGNSCGKQEVFNDYYNEARALNLQDSFKYGFKENKVFTLNELNADIKLSGIDTLWELDCEKPDNLVITYTSENKSGDFKVVLVKPNQEVEVLFENTEEGTKYKKIPMGKNYIRIIGSQSDVAFEIDYKVGDQTKITMNQVEDGYRVERMKELIFDGRT